MRRGALALAALLAGPVLAWAEAPFPDPEQGNVTGGVYANRYFGLAYPLPPGWGEGLSPPQASITGYYVLSTPQPTEPLGATLVIAAQDAFFAAAPLSDATAMVEDLRRSAARTDGLSAGPPPRQVTIAGRRFVRVDIGGVVLSRIVFATDIRCHIVSITLGSPDPVLLEKLAASLEALSFPAEDAAAAPVCVRDYVSDATLRRKVEVAPAGASFMRIPVRIIIGSDGKVRHVHVIRAFPAQAAAVEAALAQWEFAPYRVNGTPVEVETGLILDVKPGERRQ